MSIRTAFVSFLTGVAALCLVTDQLPAAIILGDGADNELNEGPTLGTVTLATGRVGASSGMPTGGRNTLFVFQLPDLGAGNFTAADLQLNLATKTGTVNFNADVYLLGTQTGATLVIGSGVLSTNRYYEGDAVDSNATLIQQNFATSGTSLGLVNTNATGDGNLLTQLNLIYNNGAGAGLFLVFRVNPDTNGGTTAVGYNLNSADATGTAQDPTITYTFVPEPGSGVLLALGAAFALARLRRR
jgi:hypothetical protein